MRLCSSFDGKEGMEQAFSKVPDIIVSDIMMPEMDGILIIILVKCLRVGAVCLE